MDAYEDHLDRIRSAVNGKYSLDTIPEWIAENTYLNGRRFSFVDHEYQLQILRDKSPQKVIKKCSQVGLSEITSRWALAMCNIVPGFTCLMTLMTAHYAAQFMRSRIDVCISESPVLKNSLHMSTDNADMKRFSNNSFLYLKGSQSTNSALSIPVSALLHDELDASDPEIISTYQSRLTHSKWKLKTWLSTPTLPNMGIDAEFNNSRRHFEHLRCSHCNTWFLPDYYKHVRIPGFTGDLEDITKNNLPDNYSEAFVECPSCGGVPNFGIEHRNWVCENPEDTHIISSGYQVSPFCAPAYISPGYLVMASTQYSRRTLFMNQNLGLAAEDKESTLLSDDLLPCLIPRVEMTGVSHVIGIDMGNMCHIVVLAVSATGACTEVHSEKVSVIRVVERRKELAKQYSARISIMDSMPMAETVYRAQLDDPNVYGAIFTNLKGLETHSIKTRDQNWDDGVLNLRQININRNRAMDSLMDFIRSGQYKKFSSENNNEWLEHMQSMKRVKEFSHDDELQYIWKKTNGQDHWFHATLYAVFASRIIGVGVFYTPMPSLFSTFKLKTSI